MSTNIYQVTAQKAYGRLAKGMQVEIIIRNASRPPNQREVITALNQKYGAGTALNGLSLQLFEVKKL